ncbi:MAG: hypothetical protein KatS3mg016_1660 [Fimbriimonadales bacterium]|nr:MAG: hypothetical protein KatS3mg016_1660 [Fimbriimonadales bacterium]
MRRIAKRAQPPKKKPGVRDPNGARHGGVNGASQQGFLERPRIVAPVSRELQRTLYGHLFILPWLTGFMLFTLYPILATLYFSFTDYNVLGTPRWVGLQNYQSLTRRP